ALRFAIRRSCEIKAQIVAEDEREHGRRALLNLGHTFGHALEAIGRYERWLHGEAVAIGTMLAAYASTTLGGLDPAECKRIEALLARAGLPTSAPGIEAESMLDHMTRDKKANRDGTRLVLLESIGRARLSRPLERGSLLAVLERCLET